MKHATYLQRVSRHIGTTAVLVPSRRLWSASSERVPVIVDDVPVAEVAAAHVGRSAPEGRAEARPTLGARDARAIDEAIADVEGEVVRHAVPAKSREERENVGWASARPAVAEAQETPTIAEDAPAPEGGRLKPALRSAAAVVSGAVGEESRYESLDEAATEPVRLAEIATPQRMSRQSQVQTHVQAQEQLHAASAIAATKAATATSTSTSTEEPSVHIGTIEVHIAPPAPPAPRPSPAPKTAPAKLARGFASTFGLRQE
ncbi:MAG TPA: hypothetical protein VF266_00460 [Thermoanaerobaculia bacterium]